MRLLRSTTLLIAAVLVSTAALPQSRSSGSKKAAGEAVFRCVDANGQAHFGDSQPPQCFGRDTQVLNERGTVLRVIEGEQSRAARVKAEAQEAIARKQRDERALRDRMLIETYLSVEDIERLRNQRLELLEAQVNVTKPCATKSRFAWQTFCLRSSSTGDSLPFADFVTNGDQVFHDAGE